MIFGKYSKRIPFRIADYRKERPSVVFRDRPCAVRESLFFQIAFVMKKILLKKARICAEKSGKIR